MFTPDEASSRKHFFCPPVCCSLAAEWKTSRNIQQFHVQKLAFVNKGYYDSDYIQIHNIQVILVKLGKKKKKKKSSVWCSAWLRGLGELKEHSDLKRRIFFASYKMPLLLRMWHVFLSLDIKKLWGGERERAERKKNESHELRAWLSDLLPFKCWKCIFRGMCLIHYNQPLCGPFLTPLRLLLCGGTSCRIWSQVHASVLLQLDLPPPLVS